MPSPDAIPPAPDGYLRRVLWQGSMPFRYRSGVRTLLGMPASEDAVVGTASMPPIEFPYAVSPSLTAMAAPDSLAADRWVEAALNDLDNEEWTGLEHSPARSRQPPAVGASGPSHQVGTEGGEYDPQSGIERAQRNPSTTQVGAVEAAPPPRSEQESPTIAPRAALPQVTPVDVVPLPTLVSRRSLDGAELAKRNPGSQVGAEGGGYDPQSGIERAQRNPSTLRIGAVGAVPPPRSGQKPPALAPKTVLPQVTPVNAAPTPTLVSQAGEPPSENLSTTRPDTVEAAPPPRSGQGPVAIVPRAALPQVTSVDIVPLPTLVSQTGAPPSEASLGEPDGDPGSAARTHVSSVLQSAGFTAVPTRMDNRKAGPPVVPTPMPLADAPPGIGITASAYQPASSAAEQIARLRRTVAELAAQVTAQRDFQQRPTPLFPPPVRPVANVERPVPRTGTSRAFWERSYINRLYRWSGR